MNGAWCALGVHGGSLQSATTEESPLPTTRLPTHQRKCICGVAAIAVVGHGLFLPLPSAAASAAEGVLDENPSFKTTAVKEANRTGLSEIKAVARGAKLSALPAFPGAEGFGALAVSGRGGKVVKVTSLADSGPGSFRAAMLTPGRRTIIFDVAGTIELKSPMIMSGATYSFLTVAGQSAPGDGYTNLEEYLNRTHPRVRDRE